VSIGFVDKLYWRRTDARRHRQPFEARLRPERGGWHVFKRCWDEEARRSCWVALCDDRIELDRSGGQSSCRPPAFLRCYRCDELEAERRQGGQRPDHLTLQEAEDMPVWPVRHRLTREHLRELAGA